MNEPAAEQLVGDLWILYAFDSPSGIGYVSWEDILATPDVTRETVRSVAVENLRGLLPDIGLVGTGPLYQLTAEGNYETSLLLMDELWETHAAAVPGDLVVGVPARDMLYFTGADSAEGVRELREAVDAGIARVYPVSEGLFRRRDGKWEVWEQTTGSDDTE